jgi:hypothetical protein
VGSQSANRLFLTLIVLVRAALQSEKKDRAGRECSQPSARFHVELR